MVKPVDRKTQICYELLKRATAGFSVPKGYALYFFPYQ
jgi:hypothetical protein